MMTRSSRAALLPLLGAGGLSFCACTPVCPEVPNLGTPVIATPPAMRHSPPNNEMVHALFDAGSSGLRLQIYTIARAADGSCTAGPREPAVDISFQAKDKAQKKALQTGLANMTRRPADPTDQNLLDATDLNAVRAQQTFPKAENVLAALWDTPHFDKRRISGVALLGTGGFRDPARIKRGARLMMRKLNRIIEDWRPTTATEQDWEAVTIEGEEEAVYSWLTARELGAKEGHVIIEIGGQTCQYATSDTSGWTHELGADYAKRKLLPEVAFHDACMGASAEGGKSPAPPRADACIAAFAKEFAESSIIKRGANRAERPEGSELWAMGSGWKYVFLDYLLTRSPPVARPEPAVGEHFKLDDLYTFATQVCSEHPPAYPKNPDGSLGLFEPEAWCMRISHAVAFALNVYAAKDKDHLHLGDAAAANIAGIFSECKMAGNTIVYGKESYTRGAAVSSNLFRECHSERASPSP